MEKFEVTDEYLLGKVEEDARKILSHGGNIKDVLSRTDVVMGIVTDLLKDDGKKCAKFMLESMERIMKIAMEGSDKFTMDLLRTMIEATERVYNSESENTSPTH